jgi:hypothetical protein
MGHGAGGVEKRSNPPKNLPRRNKKLSALLKLEFILELSIGF